MKPLTLGDLICAARRVHSHAACNRPAVARRLALQAEAAHRHARLTGKAHPCWGNGTLMACAGAQALPPTPRLDDAEFLETIATVASALAVVRRRSTSPAGRRDRIALN